MLRDEYLAIPATGDGMWFVIRLLDSGQYEHVSTIRLSKSKGAANAAKDNSKAIMSPIMAKVHNDHFYVAAGWTAARRRDSSLLSCCCPLDRLPFAMAVLPRRGYVCRKLTIRGDPAKSCFIHGQIGIDQHFQHHAGVIGRVAPPIPQIGCVEGRQIAGVDRITDKIGQVRPWQAFLGAGREQVRLVRSVRAKCSSHDGLKSG